MKVNDLSDLGILLLCVRLLVVIDLFVFTASCGLSTFTHSPLRSGWTLVFRTRMCRSRTYMFFVPRSSVWRPFRS